MPRQPDPAPPSALHAWLAVVASPMLGWAAWRLCEQGLLGHDALLAVLTGGIAWVVAALHSHHTALCAHEDALLRRHLGWHDPVALRDAADPGEVTASAWQRPLR